MLAWNKELNIKERVKNIFHKFLRYVYIDDEKFDGRNNSRKGLLQVQSGLISATRVSSGPPRVSARL